MSTYWKISIGKAFYRVAAEPDEAAQLCMFILGMRYLYLGVLMYVFRVRYAVYILVTAMFLKGSTVWCPSLLSRKNNQ